MGDHGYNPAEMPPLESVHAGRLEEPNAVKAARVVDLRPCPRHARAGEPVRICFSIVKSDRRETFARHVSEITAPAFRAVRPDAYGSLRLLEPSRPNVDGSWTFVWLMDPAVPGEDYEIEPVYEACYGVERGSRHVGEWEDCHVRERLVYALAQSEW